MFQGIDKFPSGPKNCLGIVEGNTARFGEHQGFLGTGKQRFTQTFLELADLGAERRLRDMQSCGCSRKIPREGHFPKITQMMIIE